MKDCKGELVSNLIRFVRFTPRSSVVSVRPELFLPLYCNHKTPFSPSDHQFLNKMVPLNFVVKREQIL